MRFEEIVQGLGERLGVELQCSDGVCTLGVDDMTVTMQLLEGMEERLCVYAEIGDPPPQGLEQLLSAMLNANHLFQGTAGATISQDPTTGKFCLCRYDPLDMLDVDKFMTFLEHFVNTLETWRKLLVDYRPAEEGARSAESEPEVMPMYGGNGFMTV